MAFPVGHFVGADITRRNAEVTYRLEPEIKFASLLGLYVPQQAVHILVDHDGHLEIIVFDIAPHERNGGNILAHIQGRLAGRQGRFKGFPLFVHVFPSLPRGLDNRQATVHPKHPHPTDAATDSQRDQNSAQRAARSRRVLCLLFILSFPPPNQI